MTRPTVPPAQIAATAVIPPHAGSGPLSPAQLRIARARLALEPLAVLVVNAWSGWQHRPARGSR